MPTPEMYMPVNINSKQKSLHNRKLGLSYFVKFLPVRFPNLYAREIGNLFQYCSTKWLKCSSSHFV